MRRRPDHTGGLASDGHAGELIRVSAVPRVAEYDLTRRLLPWIPTTDMHLFDIARVLILLAAANGTPVIARKMFGDRLGWPLDFGAALPDAQPLFGRAKTFRGIVVALCAATAVAPILRLPAGLGALVAAGAMIGDLLSSFTKRRLHLHPSSQATGLDQVPEALLPLLLCMVWLPLTLADVVLGTLAFFVGDVLLSRLLYRLHLRERPY